MGAGQVGTFAARYIQQAGERVTAADISPAAGYFGRFGPKHGVPNLEVDILNEELLAHVIKASAADKIVLSAGPIGSACLSDKSKAWKVNVDGPRAVAEASVRLGVKRLVFISSLSVYGRFNGPVKETAKIEPCSEYGKTKAAAEAALETYRNKGLDVRIVRPCGIYGPIRLGSGSQSARFIEAALLSAIRLRRLNIRSSADASDEYLYVKDLAEAIAKVALTEATNSDYIFNVGSGKRTCAKDIGQAIQELVPGVEVLIEEVAGVNGSWTGALDISRINHNFNFRPRFDLLGGLSDYINEAGFV